MPPFLLLFSSSLNRPIQQQVQKLQLAPTSNGRGCALVLDTFRIASAERVPSEWGQSRYIADIFYKDIYMYIYRASHDILPLYLKTSKTWGRK